MNEQQTNNLNKNLLSKEELQDFLGLLREIKPENDPKFNEYLNDVKDCIIAMDKREEKKKLTKK